MLNLLPHNATALERLAAEALAQIERAPIPLRQLWNPSTCPVALLPYLAWAFSVDRWDSTWPERVKRQVIRDAYLVHSHKGTLSALRRVVRAHRLADRHPRVVAANPCRRARHLRKSPSTSATTVSTKRPCSSLERLLDDVRPVSRHLTRLDLRITPDILARHGLATIDGDTLQISPWKQ